MGLGMASRAEMASLRWKAELPGAGVSLRPSCGIGLYAGAGEGPCLVTAVKV